MFAVIQLYKTKCPPSKTPFGSKQEFFSWCLAALQEGPALFSSGESTEAPVHVYFTKKGWLKGRLDLSLSRSKPCSHAGCLVGVEHRFASLPICQMGLLLHSGTTGMGARQEPVGRWRLYDLAAPDICAGTKKAIGVGGFMMWKLHRDLKQTKTTGFFVLTKAAEQRVKSFHFQQFWSVDRNPGSLGGYHVPLVFMLLPNNTFPCLLLVSFLSLPPLFPISFSLFLLLFSSICQFSEFFQSQANS